MGAKTGNTWAEVASINNTVLALFIVLKIVAMKNPGFEWFSWWGVIGIPVMLQLLLIFLIKVTAGLGAKIGQAIYFRKLERVMNDELKKGATAAKADQAERLKKV